MSTCNPGPALSQSPPRSTAKSSQGKIQSGRQLAQTRRSSTVPASGHCPKCAPTDPSLHVSPESVAWCADVVGDPRPGRPTGQHGHDTKHQGRDPADTNIPDARSHGDQKTTTWPAASPTRQPQPTLKSPCAPSQRLSFSGSMRILRIAALGWNYPMPPTTSRNLGATFSANNRRLCSVTA